MRKILTIFYLLITAFAKADDTATVQAAVSTGSITHGSYTISSAITLNHSFNLNGSTINYTASTGRAFLFTAANIKLYNGKIIGPNDTSNPSGSSGITFQTYDHDTVANIQITTFPGYGMVGNNGNSPVITDCKIMDTGYIGLYYNNTANSITGGELARDTIDRTALPASTVTEGALMLRGTTTYPATGWYVHDCRLIMPTSPTDITAECMETRYTPSARFNNVFYSGGSIGASIANSNYVRVTNSTMTGQNQEGLEIYNSQNGFSGNLTINGQLNDGILFDGSPASAIDTLYNVSVNGANRYCIYFYNGVNTIFINACNFTSTSANYSLNVQQAYNLTFLNTNLNGNGIGTYAFEFATSVGGVDMTGGSITNFTGRFAAAYSVTPIVVDNIFLRGVTRSGVTMSINNSGSATLGTNIFYSLSQWPTSRIPVFGGGKILH